MLTNLVSDVSLRHPEDVRQIRDSFTPEYCQMKIVRRDVFVWSRFDFVVIQDLRQGCQITAKLYTQIFLQAVQPVVDGSSIKQSSLVYLFQAHFWSGRSRLSIFFAMSRAYLEIPLAVVHSINIKRFCNSYNSFLLKCVQYAPWHSFGVDAKVKRRHFTVLATFAIPKSEALKFITYSK